MLKQYFQMESANRRRERRKKKKSEQVQIWRSELGIGGNFESYEENQFYVLSKAMELNKFLKHKDSIKEDKIRQLEQENLAQKKINLALSSKNGPRELKIRKLEDQIKQSKQELREKDGEVENFKAQIWPQGFDNYA